MNEPPSLTEDRAAHISPGNLVPPRRTGKRFAQQSAIGEMPPIFGDAMATKQAATTAANGQATAGDTATVSRERLIELLNEDLTREYQAIIAYVVYSQVLKGAQYMKIAAELEAHAREELDHAMTIAKQIDYLGGM